MAASCGVNSLAMLTRNWSAGESGRGVVGGVVGVLGAAGGGVRPAGGLGGALVVVEGLVETGAERAVGIAVVVGLVAVVEVGIEVWGRAGVFAKIVILGRVTDTTREVPLVVPMSCLAETPRGKGSGRSTVGRRT
jgi:hypothetical protein